MAKYSEIIVIQFKYGSEPWEDVCEYHLSDYENERSRTQAVKNDLAEYRLSGGGIYKSVKRRIKNEK